jgi:hypothetical protein
VKLSIPASLWVLMAGESFFPDRWIVDSVGVELHRADLEWSSSDPMVASVDERGQVFAHKIGEVTITATVEGVHGSIRVIVQPTAFSSIWFVSADDVFVAGSQGAIFHYGGDNWGVMESGTEVSLRGIWGAARDDVFAVGDQGTVIHYNGSGWSEMSGGTSTELHAVWGSAGDDVFAVGAGGTIIHYDGNSWTDMPTGTPSVLYGVWGSSDDDIFAVGENGTILHHDDISWTEMASGASDNLYDVWGLTGTSVYVVGETGTILYYNGQSWVRIPSGVDELLMGIWGSNERNVFAVGLPETISCSAFGEHGDLCNATILHYQGNYWKGVGWPGTYDALMDVSGSSHTDVYVVGSFSYMFSVESSSTIHHFDGVTWNLLNLLR